MKSGDVYWITGLSGSGKTTLCKALTQWLRYRSRPVVMLDGDDLRALLGATKAYTRNERLILATSYSRLCHMIVVQGIDVVIGTISLFNEIHNWNRTNIPRYHEIYLAVPMEELMRRDPKQLYSRAAIGELTNVAGLDCEIEEPQCPDVRIDWVPSLNVSGALRQVIEHLELDNK